MLLSLGGGSLKKLKSKLENIREILKVIPETYSLAKEQSGKIDQILEFRSEDIEKELIAKSGVKSAMRTQQERQTWIGYDVQAFQTPYSELAEMVRLVNPAPGELWVDLGAGYGRMGIVLAVFAPEVNFLGYEIVKERASEGSRVFEILDLERAKLSQINLADQDFQIQSADLYFIYDFGGKPEVYSVIEKLRMIAKSKKIRVIARGRGVRNWLLQDFPWLSQVEDPIHYEHWSLFKS